MKIAPILRALDKEKDSIFSFLVHTGQHYDDAMNDTFFRQLEIPLPNIHLEVGSNTHAIQTAEIMKRFEPVIDDENPDAILVVGDVNSTIACALVAAKKGVRIIHVEAGLRSFDRTMPEEINRILTDQLSDLLFTTEEVAEINLTNEGINSNKIHFVGNVMIDTLFHNLEKAATVADILQRHNIELPSLESDYGILTLHRPSNVDGADVLQGLLETLNIISEKLPLIFPVHPRTSMKIKEAKLEKLLSKSGIVVLEPLSYLDLLGLMRNARLVLTDSGGIQEETTALGIPCVTLRENTERPITISNGTNTLVGTRRDKILEASEETLKKSNKTGKIPKYWDGHAADRIVDVLKYWL